MCKKSEKEYTKIKEMEQKHFNEQDNMFVKKLEEEKLLKKRKDHFNLIPTSGIEYKRPEA